jgi:hypothetical protein
LHKIFELRRFLYTIRIQKVFLAKRSEFHYNAITGKFPAGRGINKGEILANPVMHPRVVSVSIMLEETAETSTHLELHDSILYPLMLYHRPREVKTLLRSYLELSIGRLMILMSYIYK